MREETTTLKTEIIASGVVGPQEPHAYLGLKTLRDSTGSPFMTTSPFFVPRTRDGAQPSI
jgi:hypothetical protein